MVISICSFTQEGKKLKHKLISQFPDFLWIQKEERLAMNIWLSDIFSKRLPVIFVGAAGIAVRYIAEFVKDKLSDSPVLVIDEKGNFVIPILSGHAGGANELAKILSEGINAQAVITTATDVEQLFSVDVFAVRNGLKIVNRNGIKLFSAKLLENQKEQYVQNNLNSHNHQNQKLTVWVSPEIEIMDTNIPLELEMLPSEMRPDYADLWIEEVDEDEDFDEINKKCLLLLSPKKLCAGIGCKKDKTFEEIKSFVEKCITEKQKNDLCSVSSINLKKNEIGLQTFAQYLNIPFKVYTAEELEKIENTPAENFSESDFVKQITGTGNVCERAALLSAGKSGKLIIKKQAADGITFALAEKKPSITNWSTK